jgi:acetyltransferase-like isoleucine patch superfamily enzyme
MAFISIYSKITTLYTKLKFAVHGVHYGKQILSRGIPILDISLKGNFKVGRNCIFNNAHYFNTIGRQQYCCFSVGNGASLEIGDFVGISSSTIVCKNNIEIEDHVHIGGNCEIYDTDFHDLDYKKRTTVPEQYDAIKTRPIKIKKYAFIGAHTTILKGVTIGEGAIIGAGSVVSKNIPPYEIWAGNPACFIAKAIGNDGGQIT